MESNKVRWVLVMASCALLLLLACQLSVQFNPTSSTRTVILTASTNSTTATDLTTISAHIIQNTLPSEQPVSVATSPLQATASQVVIFATATLESGATSITLPTDTPDATNPPISTDTPANIIPPICPQLPTPTQALKSPLSQKGKTPIPPTPSAGCLFIRNLSPFTITISLWSGCSGTLLGGTSDSIVSQGEKLLLLPPGCYGLAAGQTVRMNVNIIAGYTTVVDVQQ